MRHIERACRVMAERCLLRGCGPLVVSGLSVMDDRASGRPKAGWFVVTTQPRREAYAIENLARQGFRTYCPQILKTIRHARRTSLAPRPLFPSYVFVEKDSAMERWRYLLSTYGVRSLVRSANGPGVLDDRFIAALVSREVDGVLRRPEHPFSIGQNVELKCGAFDGLIATILDLRENGRIVVLMNLLNQPTRVVLSEQSLSPV